MQNKREFGAEGEGLAADYLKGLGYKIIKRNFHFGRSGEIDLIAEDGSMLVFVEVKTRNSFSYGNPLESINYKKQMNIRKVAEGYYYVNKLVDKQSRFDVVVVDTSGPDPKFEHLIDAF